MPTPKSFTRVNGDVGYRVRFRHANKDTSKTFDREKDAEWFCQQITHYGTGFALSALANLERELGPDIDETPTLTEVVTAFLEWKTNYVRSKQTITAYKRTFENHIEPTLGGRTIGSIRPADIDALIEDMVAGKILNRHIKDEKKDRRLSPKTIRGCHSLLHQVMEFAMMPRNAWIQANPCKGRTNLPKRIKPAAKGMTPMQWQALKAAFLQLGYDDAADLGEFLLGTGWRIGEAIALPVANVEDYGTSMWVTMNQVARLEGGVSSIVAAEGKAQHSIRRIQVDPETAAVIRRRCEGKRHDELVFQWANTKPWGIHNFRDRLEKACELANLPHITPHAFRHTHVAWLAMSGAPIPELQRRIGHASIETTIGVYGGMIGDVNVDTLGKFTAMRNAGTALTPKEPVAAIEGEVA